LNKAKLSYYFKIHTQGLVNSYSQLFLADSYLLAALVILASFINIYVGLYGLLSVVLTNFFANILNYNHHYILKGYYGFNSLLVGLFIGYTYAPSWQLLIFSAFASFLCFVLTIVIAGLQANKKLPFLSLPFLFTVWLIILATPHFTSLVDSDSSIFIYNDLMKLGGSDMVNAYHFYDNIELPQIIDVYLKSLGAIIFQYNIVAGILIVIGLLIFSRIAFMLSVVGFLSGYYFFILLQGNIGLINYTYIGFNFILAAIAIGGYFLLSNSYSFLLVIIAAPIISMIIAASATILGSFGLPVLSLPFNIMVIMVLYFLYNRVRADKLKLTQVQLFSPEKNLYRYLNEKARYNDEVYIKIGLPFYGEWYISQGQNGNITHKNEYQFAWDFVIKDDELKTFRLPGTNLEDYYCYSLPVLAPADGYVVDIIDGVDDNLIGDVNLQQNWGNTLIIKHAEFLYSKISHIKKESFKVAINDYVYKDQVLASNGSSGRSPEPHVHFQLQSTAVLAATTIKYPLSNYIVKENNKYVYYSNGIPKENDIVANATINSLLKSAFYLIPGKKLNWDLKFENGKSELVKWEVFTDISNYSYLYCFNTKSTAWFCIDSHQFYFTSFEGNKNSLLYSFYINAHKILFSYYQDMVITDSLPIYDVFKPLNRLVNDFILPFKNLLSAEYRLTYFSIDDYLYTKNIVLQSNINLKSTFMVNKHLTGTITLSDAKIQQFESTIKGVKFKAICEVL
jgi:urea transporter/murein DD-endopeptidase MepM/ murein hydrolase activator NlpD